MPAKLFVEVVVSKSGDLILKGLKGDVLNLNKSLKGTHDISRQLATGFKLLASAWALLKIKNFTKDWMNLYEEMEKADRLLDQAAANSAKYSRAWSQSTRAMANALQDLTGTHRSAIELGQRLLVTFDEITNDMLPRATLAMVNYAAFTGVSMNSAAKAVGKSSMGLLGDLKRVGVQVDEETYRLKGFVGMLEQMENQMGGQAETFRKTTAGQWAAWANEIKDVKIELGNIFDTVLVKTGLLGIFTKNIENLSDLLYTMTINQGFLDDLKKMMTDLASIVKSFAQFLQLLTTAAQFARKFQYPEETAAKIQKRVAGYMKNVTSEREIGYMDYLSVFSMFSRKETWIDLEKQATDYEKGSGIIDTFLKNVIKITDSIIKDADDFTESVAGKNLSRHYIDMPPQNRIIPEISIWTYIWQDFTQDITGIFQRGWIDSLTKMELDFSKFAQQLNAKMANAFIKRIWDETAFTLSRNVPTSQAYGGPGMSRLGLLGPGYGAPVESKTTTTKVEWGQIMGAAAAAYATYQGGSVGQGAIGGAMAGGQISGSPWGALIGGVLGAGLGYLGKKDLERNRPSISLLWEVVDGEIELVAEEWKNTARDKGVIDSMRQALQAQVDFFNQIAFIAERAGLNVTAQTSFATGGIPATSAGKYQTFMGNVGAYETMFGGAREVEANIQKIIYEYLQNPFLKTPVTEVPEKLSTLTNLTDAFFEEIEEKFIEISDFMANSIGNAFIDALETGDYKAFERGIKEGLYNSTVGALTQAFVDKHMISTFGQALDVGGLTSLISSYGTPGGATGGEVISGIKDFFSKVPGILEEMEPIMQEFITGMSALQIALDINTEALYGNIESLRDYINTIEGTIGALTVSELAPALTHKVFGVEYERLLGGAGTQEGLRDFVSYIQSEYLPFMRDYATDYKTVFDNVIADLEELKKGPEEGIADILHNIYENLGGDSNKLIDIMTKLDLTLEHISESTLGGLGINPDMTKREMVQPATMVVHINGQPTQIDTATGEVLGPAHIPSVLTPRPYAFPR